MVGCKRESIDRGIHLNLGKNKASNKAKHTIEKENEKPDSVIANLDSMDRDNKWWQPADPSESFWLSGVKTKSPKNEPELSENQSKL